MNKILKDDKYGFAPIIAVLYGLVGLIGLLGWIFILGNFLFALGFTATSLFLIKWGKKKWLPGVMAMLVVLATLIVAYMWFTGVSLT